jgi:hypothetical protein
MQAFTLETATRLAMPFLKMCGGSYFKIAAIAAAGPTYAGAPKYMNTREYEKARKAPSL